MNWENSTNENMLKAINKILDHCDIRSHDTQKELLRNYTKGDYLEITHETLLTLYCFDEHAQVTELCDCKTYYKLV